MKSTARAIAGRKAWAAKSPAEKARIRARLAAGRAKAARSNNKPARSNRGNLTNKEAKVIRSIVSPRRRKSSGSGSRRSSAPSTAVDSRKRDPSGRIPTEAQLRARAEFAAAAKARAAEARAATPGSRKNVSPKERKKLTRLLNASRRRRAVATNKAFKSRNEKRAAAGLAPLKRHRRKASKGSGTGSRRRSSRRSSARSNTYIARPNAYMLTRANPKRRRRNARRNMYIRRNPGMEKVKSALILAGLGIGSFMLTNVAQHFVGKLEFAKGAVADYGVPAVLTALVWFGPTGKMLAGNKAIGRNGQIALTAGIVGAVVNKALDGIVTSNLAKIPAIGEPFSKLLLGWPIISEDELLTFGGGTGEYVYDLPDSGMGEYVRDPNMLSVEQEMKGLAYVNLEQRAANEAALAASNIEALQPEISNAGSQFDDQFDPPY